MRLITISIILVLLWGCNANVKEANKYHENILSINEKVVQAEDSLIGLISSSNTTNIVSVYNNLSSVISISIDTISALPHYEGDTALRNASLRLLDVYKMLSKDEYADVIRIITLPEEEYTYEEDTRLINKSDTINLRIEKALECFIRAQDEFIKKFELGAK